MYARELGRKAWGRLGLFFGSTPLCSLEDVRVCPQKVAFYLTLLLIGTYHHESQPKLAEEFFLRKQLVRG